MSWFENPKQVKRRREQSQWDQEWGRGDRSGGGGGSGASASGSGGRRDSGDYNPNFPTSPVPSLPAPSFSSPSGNAPGVGMNQEMLVLAPPQTYSYSYFYIYIHIHICFLFLLTCKYNYILNNNVQAQQIMHTLTSIGMSGQAPASSAMGGPPVASVGGGAFGGPMGGVAPASAPGTPACSPNHLNIKHKLLFLDINIIILILICNN
jgi:hypothetical protein